MDIMKAEISLKANLYNGHGRIFMKSKVLQLLAIGLLTGVLLTGCKNPIIPTSSAGTNSSYEMTSSSVGENENSIKSDTGSSSIPTSSYSIQSSNEGTEITSLQAAKIAYNEAKAWRSDAVLWSMQPVYYSLDANWSDNDLASFWVIQFACRSDETCYTVTIQNGEVIGSSAETSTVRSIDVPVSISVDQPKVTMKDAAAVAIENGMQSHPMDIMIMYLVQSYTEEWSGKPFWQFAFNISSGAYCCAVDGVTGKLIDLVDANGNSVDPLSIQSKEETPEGDSKEVVTAFFGALNKGNSDEALGMMLSSKTSDPETMAAWKSGFDSIETVKVEKIEDSFPESWSSGHEYYKCTLSVKLKSDAVMSIWDDGEIVRYIHMEGENGVWKISEISTNP